MPEPLNFFTPISIPESGSKIGCATRILGLGSCFSDHIGQRMTSHCFDAMINPFGTIFNPMSMAKLMQMALSSEFVTSKDIEERQGRYFHYDFHSSLDRSNRDSTARAINEALEAVGNYLRTADFLILTFGTSIVHKLKSNGEVVSNCHKVASSNFDKALLSTDEMFDSLRTVIDSIRKENPGVKIILTVSPVRHTREGLVNNNRSKSRLIDLCHLLVEELPQVTYFPSYEIMMDELRDYRFYAADLIHPNQIAVDHIWSYFTTCFFDEKALNKLIDMASLIKARQHRPFDPDSDSHLKFKKAQLKKIVELSQSYPEVNFNDFRIYFSD